MSQNPVVPKDLRDVPALMEQGEACEEACDLLGAIGAFTAAAVAFACFGDLEGQVAALVRAAAVHVRMGRHEEAVCVYHEAAGAARPLADGVRLAQVLNNQGLSHVRLSALDEARVCFGEACELYREAGHKAGVADQLQNLGSVHRDARAFEEALRYYFGALALYEEVADPVNVANQYANIGYVYAMLKDAAEAADWFAKALPVYEEHGELVRADFTRQNLESLRAAPSSSHPEE